jgi:DNA end-binding protein Ku
VPPREEETSIARSFWSGTITFGLVSIPVALFPANRTQRVSLRMLDESGTPLARRYYDPGSKGELDGDEIVRGYEIEKDEFVIVTDEELESLAPDRSRDIDLRRFVQVEEIDPLWFERAYFLAPAGNSNKAYRLLAATMEKTARAGIATFVMRGKEYLVAIMAQNGILRAETLRFPEEIRSADDVGLPALKKAKPGAVSDMRRAIRELAAAELDVAELEDRQAQQLRALIEQKRQAGEDVVTAPETAGGDTADDGVIDLMALLKRSLQAGADAPASGRATRGGSAARRRRKPAGGKSGSGKSGSGRKPARRTAGSLTELSREELYRRAQELGIPGRSGMTKAQLARAIEEAA